MSTFIGTPQEFKRYIGPRLRNFVQMITKKHKASVGACEHCGSDEGLESAHVKGRDRNQIIDLLLAAISTESVVTVELERFESNFKFEHAPVEKAVLILCRQCHKTYDRAIYPTPPTGPDLPLVVDPVGTKPVIDVPFGLLPITLEPPRATDFRRQFLASRRADITTFYVDGRVEHRLWEASKFSETSNLMGNLRSRPEFRQGAWQRSGIVKVHVRVVGQDASSPDPAKSTVMNNSDCG